MIIFFLSLSLVTIVVTSLLNLALANRVGVFSYQKQCIKLLSKLKYGSNIPISKTDYQTLKKKCKSIHYHIVNVTIDLLNLVNAGLVWQLDANFRSIVKTIWVQGCSIPISNKTQKGHKKLSILSSLIQIILSVLIIISA